MVPVLNKRGAVNPLIVLLILGIAFTFVAPNLDLGSLIGFETVYKQNWGHIECVQNFDYDIVYSRLLKDRRTFDCNDYTNECRITIHNEKEKRFQLGVSGSYQMCDAFFGSSLFQDRSNCGTPTSYSLGGADSKEVTIPVGKSLVFKTGFFVVGEDYTRITKQAKSFYIRGVENGKVFVQESCVLNSELKRKTPSDGLNELTKTGTNSRQNYLIDFISVASKTYEYQNEEVICQARDLYGITNQAFKDGKIKKIQGERITGVECCPHEANCNVDTFQFVDNNVRECTFSSECPNGGQPIAVDPTHYKQFSCSAEGQCIEGSPVSVECTTSSECTRKFGQGSVCDLSTNNYGKCVSNTKPNYCGDNTCNLLDGENGQTCPADCVSQNETAPWWLTLPWYVYVFGALLILISLGILRRYLKMIPFIGKAVK
jgi:hypothetical protein